MRPFRMTITVDFFAEDADAAMVEAERVAFREDGGQVQRLEELSDAGETVEVLVGETNDERLRRLAHPDCPVCYGVGQIYYMDDGPTSRTCDCVTAEPLE